MNERTIFWLTVARKVLVAAAALLGALTGVGTVVPQVGEPLGELLQLGDVPRPAGPEVRRSVSCWSSPVGPQELEQFLVTSKPHSGF